MKIIDILKTILISFLCTLGSIAFLMIVNEYIKELEVIYIITVMLLIHFLCIGVTMLNIRKGVIDGR
jgi:ABC-type polysaccharide/polyol phosphate export permease